MFDAIIIEGWCFLSINCAHPPFWQMLFTRTVIWTSSIDIEVQILLFHVWLAKIWIHRSHTTPWLPSDQPVPEQTKPMSQQWSTKRNYMFSLLHSHPYILVWRPHSIYHMNYGYYGVFHKYTTAVPSHHKFATDKPLTLWALGLSVANFLWPRTQVVYLWNAPTSCSLYMLTLTPCLTCHILKLLCLTSAKAEKKQKYCAASSDHNATFMPLCFLVNGLAGDEANSFLQHLARSLSVKWDHNFSEILGWLHARLAFALVRTTNVCIWGSRTQWWSLGMEDGTAFPFD